MPRLLVTGAAGHLGQHVLTHLIDTYHVTPGDIVAGSRKPEALADWAAKGVEVRAVDFDQPKTLASAFAGIDRLLIISTDALGVPGQRLRQHEAAIAAAAAAGVKHVVYTSLPFADTSAVLFAPDHAGTERALAASAIPGWTVLRNHWYFENILFGLPHILATGTWVSAAGDGRLAHIARDDLARAAAAALAADFNGKRTLTPSGAQAFTVAELAEKLSAATGKPIKVVPVSADDLVAGMVAGGLPEPVARVFASFDVNQAQGKFGQVTADYKALTGVDPTPFDAWLAANQAALAGA
jgi:NAD(P)H dehydrogenase (quinone)